MRKFWLFSGVLGIMLFAGCQSLPPGRAPEGPIVGPGSRAEQYSWKGAENYLLTSLSLFCLQHFPEGTDFRIDFPSRNRELRWRTLNVLRGVREAVPVRLTAGTGAPYCLTSAMAENRYWTMRLTELKTGKIVWAEQVNLKGVTDK
ncbi:MAG: hypothetical protein PHH77_06550 [Victivallaceae bacterium]|nr:hypothetical protein [Victivallaceae bacterium]